MRFSVVAALSRIRRALENGCGADVMYLDFSKAFNKVDHGLLLCKLVNLGITGPLVEWLQHFFCDCKQRVVVEENTSSWNRVKSSVPQENVLGLVRFLVSIIDIGAGIISTISSFADDTRVFRKLSAADNQQLLQEDRESLRVGRSQRMTNSKCYNIKLAETDSSTSTALLTGRLGDRDGS